MKHKKTARVKHRVHRSPTQQRKQRETHKIMIYVVSALCLMAVVLSLFSYMRPLTRAVAGASIFRGMFAETTVTIPQIYGAVSYNIYYKPVSDSFFHDAARNIPSTSTSYTISYLKKNVRYVYIISAVNQSGAEFWWSGSMPVTNTSSM